MIRPNRAVSYSPSEIGQRDQVDWATATPSELKQPRSDPAGVRTAGDGDAVRSRCRSRTPAEQVKEEVHGIRDVHLSVAVRVEQGQRAHGRLARRRLGEEEVSEEADRVGDVQVPILRAIRWQLAAAAG